MNKATVNPAIDINAAWGTAWAQLPQVEVQSFHWTMDRDPVYHGCGRGIAKATKGLAL